MAVSELQTAFVHSQLGIILSMSLDTILRKIIGIYLLS